MSNYTVGCFVDRALHVPIKRPLAKALVRWDLASVGDEQTVEQHS
jgi:hypothetical protein